MSHSIGHLHQRLSIRGNFAAAAGVQLERLVAEEVLDAYAESLDAALGDDPTVYVVREANLRTTVAGNLYGDPTLRRAWGQGMAKAVMQMLADPANVVRFENQAAFVADFIEALLRGQAWEQWYYGAFADLRGITLDEAIGRVMLDNRPHLPDILARLGRQEETLHVLFRTVSSGTLHAVWREGLRPTGTSDAEAARPIVMSVMQWADRLNLWRAAPPSPDALIAAYFRERWLILDWRDARSLTWGFANVAQFCLAQGWLRPWVDGTPFEAALQSLDWLDRVQLRRLLSSALWREAGLSAAFEEDAAGSPRQRALLRALRDALGRVHLDVTQPDSPANALHWFGALGEQWADDPYVLDLIETFLSAWVAALRGDASETNPRANWLATLGPAGREVLEKLWQQAPQSPIGVEATQAKAQSGEERPEKRNKTARTTPEVVSERAGGDRTQLEGAFESKCAGLFLLLRAMMDARWPALAAAANRAGPALADLLPPALALHWAGDAANADPGLLLFAGQPEAISRTTLRRHWGTTDGLPLQAALLRALAGQRLVRGERMTLHRLPLVGGRTALIAEADATDVWVFSRIIEAGTPPEWLDTWEEATGYRPAVVEAADSGRLAAALDVLGMAAMPGMAANEFDLTTSLLAAALLRLWARWLGQFATSSIPYLLRQFIRRDGVIYMDDAEIRVQLDSRPLDIVLSAAGYLTALERADLLGGRRVQFTIRGS